MIESNAPIDVEYIEERRALIDQALEGSESEDLFLDCWDCGEQFIFTVGEQQFYKQKGFVHPKRCPECRVESY